MLDQDLRVKEERGERAHRGDTGGEVGGSGVNAAVVLAVLETSGRDNGVQKEIVKTMVCRTWILASCISDEV
jgi:hypothetical protein